MSSVTQRNRTIDYETQLRLTSQMYSAEPGNKYVRKIENCHENQRKPNKKQQQEQKLAAIEMTMLQKKLSISVYNIK